MQATTAVTMTFSPTTSTTAAAAAVRGRKAVPLYGPFLKLRLHRYAVENPIKP